MSNAPWFPWYPKDFETDEAVMLMNNQQRGVYLKFMNHSWLHGGIPIEEEALARLAGEPLAVFRELWPGISGCWVNGGNGRLVNRRQETERAKMLAKTEAKQEAGKRGAKAKHRQTFATSKTVAVPDFCQASARLLPVAKSSYSDSDPHSDTDNNTASETSEMTEAVELTEVAVALVDDLMPNHCTPGNRHYAIAAAERILASSVHPLKVADSIRDSHGKWVKYWSTTPKVFKPLLHKWLQDGDYIHAPKEPQAVQSLTGW